MDIVVRATVIFLFLYLLTRAMGKRELAQMSAVELILLVTIGDLVQQGVTQEDMSLTGNMLAVGTIGAWIMIVSFASYRWKRGGEALEGLPAIIVRDGELQEEALRIERLTRDEVLAEVREQGIEDLSEIRVGILETDGRFSFIKAEEGPQEDEENPQPEESIH